MTVTVREDTPLLDAMYEAASIVCHRITQFGLCSDEAGRAHDNWRTAWIKWRDSSESG